VSIGILVPNERELDRVKRLLYTYKELKHIPPTDLYEHRVRLRPGTKPYAVKAQRRWPPEKEFWLKKIIQEGLTFGICERTLIANEELSDWNAVAVLVDKQGKGDPYRATFNYCYVREDLPGCHLELMSKVHDYLSNPRHTVYDQLDLRHAYWSIRISSSQTPFRLHNLRYRTCSTYEDAPGRPYCRFLTY
jgi:hypothetical protein